MSSVAWNLCRTLILEDAPVRQHSYHTSFAVSASVLACLLGSYHFQTVCVRCLTQLLSVGHHICACIWCLNRATKSRFYEPCLGVAVMLLLPGPVS